VEPSVVLASWAAGLAAGMALVSAWRIVGPGYTWLSAGVTALLGVTAALSGSGPGAWAGCALAAVAVVAARRPGATSALGALAAVAFCVAAISEGEAAAAVTGALFLGGVTTEMMLGHWYLVDPRLPRSSLRTLALIGGIGAIVDTAALTLSGIFPAASTDAVVAWAFVALAALSILLMVGVWFALGEKGYSGVMAATGLSYLALLTALGAASAGRILL
jgi:hypothetical protein